LTWDMAINGSVINLKWEEKIFDKLDMELTRDRRHIHVRSN